MTWTTFWAACSSYSARPDIAPRTPCPCPPAVGRGFLRFPPLASRRERQARHGKARHGLSPALCPLLSGPFPRQAARPGTAALFLFQPLSFSAFPRLLPPLHSPSPRSASSPPPLHPLPAFSRLSFSHPTLCQLFPASPLPSPPLHALPLLPLPGKFRYAGGSFRTAKNRKTP